MRQGVGLLLAVLGITCARLQGGPGIMHKSDSAAFRQAKMALIVLRAVQEDSVALRGGYTFHPSRRVLDDLEAATFLANHPKPVFCSSSVIEGSLSISCRQLAANGSARRPDEPGEEMLLELRGALHSLNPDSQPITDSSLVLVTGPGDSQLFPLADLEAFLRDFRIPFSFSIVPPDGEARVKGAVGVFTVGPTEMIEAP